MDYKRVLELRFTHGLSSRDIAESTGTGKTTVNEFLKRFRECQELTYPLSEDVTNEQIEGLLYKKRGICSQDRYNAEGRDVIYIRHIIQNLPTNRLLFGYSIEGTKGAELYGGLDIVSVYIFDKLVGDALSNKKLRQLIERKDYDALHLCGLDACGCVASTALGAARRGLKVEIMREGIATVFDGRKVARTMEKLRRAGVRYID